MEYIIYTDGGCEPNPGKGAWAYISPQGIEGRGHEKMTTNNRMELQAVIEAIKHVSLKEATSITIISDSQYVVKGYCEWLPGWKSRGWKKKRNEFTGHSPGVVNDDLWRELDRLAPRNGIVKFKWVRGHNGNEWNEKADQLVRKEYSLVFGGEMRF